MAENDEKISIRFLGLLIERKTDFLAFAAFLISVGTLATQIAFFLKGPDVKLIPPRQVLINREQYSEKEHYVRLSAIMSYVNKGQPNYNDIIREELATMKIDKSVYELRWQSFISSDCTKDKLDITVKGNALPVPVIAGNVEAHETYFAPFEPRTKGVPRDKNFLAWKTFMEMIPKVNEIIFTFKSETFEGDKEEVSCRVVVSDSLRKNLLNKGWAAPGCLEMDS
jgi:hypothetical protein